MRCSNPAAKRRNCNAANNAALSAIPQMQDVFRVSRARNGYNEARQPGAGVGMAFNHKRLFDT